MAAWIAAGFAIATFVVVLALAVPMVIDEWRALLRRQ
jgi:uncharacterized membrane protein YcjF (UPF0283 family)